MNSNKTQNPKSLSVVQRLQKELRELKLQVRILQQACKSLGQSGTTAKLRRKERIYKSSKKLRFDLPQMLTAVVTGRPYLNAFKVEKADLIISKNVVYSNESLSWLKGKMSLRAINRLLDRLFKRNVSGRDQGLIKIVNLLEKVKGVPQRSDLINLLNSCGTGSVSPKPIVADPVVGGSPGAKAKSESMRANTKAKVKAPTKPGAAKKDTGESGHSKAAPGQLSAKTEVTSVDKSGLVLDESKAKVDTSVKTKAKSVKRSKTAQAQSPGPELRAREGKSIQTKVWQLKPRVSTLQAQPLATVMAGQIVGSTVKETVKSADEFLPINSNMVRTVLQVPRGRTSVDDVSIDPEIGKMLAYPCDASLQERFMAYGTANVATRPGYSLLNKLKDDQNEALNKLLDPSAKIRNFMSRKR